MKLSKVLIVASLIFSFLSLVIRFYLFPYHYRITARHFAAMEQIRKFDDLSAVDYIIIGDSYGLYSLIPKALSKDSYSLSTSGASALDVYYLLKKINLKKIKKGLILTNSMDFKNHYEIDFWERYVMLNTYSFSVLIDIYENSKAENIFPSSQYSFFSYLIKIFLNKLLFNEHSLNAIIYAPSDIVKSDSIGQYYQRETNAENGYISYPAHVQSDEAYFFKNYDDLYSKPLTITHSDEVYTEKIIKLAQENKLDIFFIIPPMASRATGKDIKNFEAVYDAFYFGLQKKFSNFFVKRLNTNLEKQDYFDFVHVNINGANKLTSEFVEAIAQLSKTADIQKVKELGQTPEMKK